jgi:uncharacterized protein YggE
MRRALIKAFLALQLSGCSAVAVPTAFAVKDVDDPGDLPTITVGGDANVRVDPDLATLTVGIEARAKEPAAAQAKVAERSRAVSLRLQDSGIPKKDIKTVGVDLYPVYSRPDKPTEAVAPVLVGYTSMLRLQVRCKPELAGDAISTAIAVGANHLEGVAFSREAIEKPRQEAIDKATAQALAKIRATLDPLGLRVKDIRKIDVSENSAAPWMPAPQNFYRDAKAAVAQNTPVSPGEIEVRATVSVVASFDRVDSGSNPAHRQDDRRVVR